MNKELNRKLAEWAGFKRLPKGNKGFHFECTEKIMNWMPPNATEWWESVTHLPNFPLSLDACFKHLVPKLMRGQCEVHTGMPDKRGQAFARVWYGFYKHYEAYAETPALALCRAIEKLIDGEK